MHKKLPLNNEIGFICARAGNLPMFVVNYLGEWFSVFCWALFFGRVA